MQPEPRMCNSSHSASKTRSIRYDTIGVLPKLQRSSRFVCGSKFILLPALQRLARGDHLAKHAHSVSIVVLCSRPRFHIQILPTDFGVGPPLPTDLEGALQFRRLTLQVAPAPRLVIFARCADGTMSLFDYLQQLIY